MKNEQELLNPASNDASDLHDLCSMCDDVFCKIFTISS